MEGQAATNGQTWVRLPSGQQLIYVLGYGSQANSKSAGRGSIPRMRAFVINPGDNFHQGFFVTNIDDKVTL